VHGIVIPILTKIQVTVFWLDTAAQTSYITWNHVAHMRYLMTVLRLEGVVIVVML